MISSQTFCISIAYIISLSYLLALQNLIYQYQQFSDMSTIYSIIYLEYALKKAFTFLLRKRQRDGLISIYDLGHHKQCLFVMNICDGQSVFFFHNI